MPELPEIRNISEELNQILQNCDITDITVNSSFGEFKKQITKLHFPLHVINVQSKGKLIYCELQAGDKKLFLTIHLGMSGAIILEPGNHVHVTISYRDCHNTNKIRKLYYDDMRKFGDLQILTPEEMQTKLNTLGPDVLSATFNLDEFKTIMNKYPNRKIADVLIDQNLIAGIGNLYRAEILYYAKTHPLTLVKNIKSWPRLFNAIKHVMDKSYSEGGSTITEYRNVYSQGGYYTPIIYKQTKDPRGNPIKILKLAGRSVYYVPAVQK